MVARDRWIPASLVAISITIICSKAAGQVVGREGVASSVTVIGIGGQSKQVIQTATSRLDDPNWSPNGSYEVIGKAIRQHGIAGDRHICWIFAYYGAAPKRVDECRGHGTSQDGGWAIVNYLLMPGEIRPDGGLATGFNRSVRCLRPAGLRRSYCVRTFQSSGIGGKVVVRSFWGM